MEEEEDIPTTIVPKIAPIQILYCGVCGLPAEYCEFGPSFEKCKPWLEKNAPELYPNLNSGEEKKTEDEKEKSSKRGGKGLVKPEKDIDAQVMPGGKVKKQEVPMVHLSRVQRNKKKYVTVVAGLEKFGVKLSDASKLMSKKFSCGASIGAGPNGDEINVQGDIIDDMVDFLEEKFNIDEDSVVIDDKPKKIAK